MHRLKLRLPDRATEPGNLNEGLPGSVAVLERDPPPVTNRRPLRAGETDRLEIALRWAEYGTETTIDLTVPETAPPPKGRERLKRALIVFGVALSSAYLWFAGATGLVSRVVPLLEGWDTVVLSSGSMEPALSPGDVVAYKPYDGSLLGPGTIIVFEDPARPGTTVTHRIAALGPDGSYVTKGDANGTADSTNVPAEAVIGVVRFVTPRAGLPAHWISTRAYLAFAALALLSLGALIVAGLHLPGEPRRRHLVSRATLAPVLTLTLAGALITVAATTATFTVATADAGAFSATSIVHENVVAAGSCGNLSNVATVTSGVPVGQFVVVRLFLRNPAGSAGLTATDSRGNVYTLDASSIDSVVVAIFSSRITTALQSGDTITTTHPNSRASAVQVDSFSGMATSGRVAATNTTIGDGTSTSLSVGTGISDTVVVGAVATADGAITGQGAGWSVMDNAAVTCNRIIYHASAYDVVGIPSTSTYNATFGATQHFAAAMVVYRAP